MSNTKKKALFFNDCERRYVEDQCTLKELYTEYKLSSKTLSSWSKEGNWDEKRKAFLEKQKTLDSGLYYLAIKLTKSITEDLDANKKVETGKYYALTSILSKIGPAKKYEDIKNKEKESGKGDIQEAIKIIYRELGIDK